MQIQGKWHSDGCAAQSCAVLRCVDGIVTIEVVDGIPFTSRLEDIVVSDRLGNVERKLTFKDGSVFSTSENDAIDILFKEYRRFNSFLYSLESHNGWVLLAIIFTILSFFSFFKWGVPWASSQIAHMLPVKVNELIASHSLKFLDDFIFEESKLENQQMDQIRLHFQTSIVPLERNSKGISYELHFREWKDFKIDIPNAFALPSGQIILTDKFVELCQNQDEMDSVLLHEMGHVVYRHTLERIIASTFVTSIVMVVTGDNNGFADLGLGLGSLLVSSNYSRNHETQADKYAFEHMLEAKIDPKAFSDIMTRMTRYMEDEKNKQKKSDGQKESKNDSIFDFISSHPPTVERVELARKYSECFQNKQLTCGALHHTNE